MSFLTVMTIAFGLSADAFAVSLGRGASGRFRTFFSAARMGLMFGASEAAMTLLGFLLAARFADYVTEADHWIALVLLGGVGGHMLYEGLYLLYPHHGGLGFHRSLFPVAGRRERCYARCRRYGGAVAYSLRQGFGCRRAGHAKVPM